MKDSEIYSNIIIKDSAKKLVDDINHYYGYNLNQNIAENLIKDGWTKHPCKCDDEFWVIYPLINKIAKGIVYAFTDYDIIEKSYRRYSFSEIGKTIFFSEEEAKKALEKI